MLEIPILVLSILHDLFLCRFGIEESVNFLTDDATVNPTIVEESEEQPCKQIKSTSELMEGTSKQIQGALLKDKPRYLLIDFENGCHNLSKHMFLNHHVLNDDVLYCVVSQIRPEFMKKNSEKFVWIGEWDGTKQKADKLIIRLMQELHLRQKLVYLLHSGDARWKLYDGPNFEQYQISPSKEKVLEELKTIKTRWNI